MQSANNANARTAGADAADILPPIKQNWKSLRHNKNDVRDAERLTEHYRLERSLARQLIDAPAAERRGLYGALYAQLFAALPDHSMRLAPAEADSSRVRRQMALLKPHVNAQTRFVEIGCGDGALSIALCRTLRSATGIDVTGALVPQDAPPVFRFIHTDGIHLDLPDACADVVYSNQLMEHLHPDDAAAQLAEICRILARGGKYICVTPSRLTGPHDISRFFDEVATGFHLKEYDYGTLCRLFRAAGLRKFEVILAMKGRQVPAPYGVVRGFERLFCALPKRLRASLANTKAIRALFAMNCVGIK